MAFNYYTWLQMFLQIGPSLCLGSKCYEWDFYYAWVPNAIAVGTLITIGSSYYTVPSTAVGFCLSLSS